MFFFQSRCPFVAQSRRILLATGLILLPLLLFGCGGSSDSEPMGDQEEGRIVFTGESILSNGYLTTAIHTMNADGTGVRQLTSGEAAIHGSFSRDGSKIVFMTHTPPYTVPKPMHIWVMNSDGTGRKHLVDVSFGVAPALSPDGSKVVFSEGNSIMIMSTDGGEPVMITPGDPKRDGILLHDTVSFSPDGSTILYTIKSDPTDYSRQHEYNAHVMNVDGTGNMLLATNVSEPAYSPDGKRIVFKRVRTPDSHLETLEIWIMNADGSAQTQLTSGFSDYRPSFSPDGTRIIFNASRRLPTSTGRQRVIPRIDITTMNVDGTNLTPIHALPRIDPFTSEPLDDAVSGQAWTRSAQ